ncbi:hypothetical protein FHR83_003494 [Actinoplanes campanulatus]|uniref:Uncharacterized protein n=1 Tax=Actinoplanes campanulatus TaxID=113559 RepID=A0A7W5AH29_9ACTN|nr:hypothetical protein [Actinoplanes campanulatus]MBB3095824.1 hypothetical protein [Actinoplanes campanulatus]GGN11843.1 hypothetical protein GCM10010109_22070 [Actinoplanes campanulatus]GID37081.1 hypothetical protein Aca09nite_35870 [Actinoplanes campanulatus]
MQLTFLGKSTQGGGSPTLYASDRGSYVVQGWRVHGQPSTTVEIPESLLRFLMPGTTLAVALVPTGHRWNGDDGECGTFTLTGERLDDDVLARLAVPGHEACIEVRERRKDE